MLTSERRLARRQAAALDRVQVLVCAWCLKVKTQVTKRTSYQRARMGNNPT